MKATDVIKRDHEAAKDLFATYKQSSLEQRDAMRDDIFKALERHEKMEDNYFYMELLKVAEDGDKEMLERLDKDQVEVEEETKKVQASDPVDEDAMLALMNRIIEHATREENEIFPVAEKVMTPEQLEELGAKMEPESATANA